MSKKKKILYSDVLALGFERENVDDEAWREQCGFDYFIMYKEYDRVSFDWDIHKQCVFMILSDVNDVFILEKKKIKSLSKLQSIIEELEFLHELKEYNIKRQLKIFEEL